LLTDRGVKIAAASPPGSTPLSNSSTEPYTIEIAREAIEPLRRGGAAFHRLVDEKDQGLRRIQVVLGSTTSPNATGGSAVISEVRQGWRPDGKGGMDYYLQMSQEQLEFFAGGAPIDCQVDPTIKSIQNIYVFAGENPLPRELPK
jgi:hypothetical protein